MYRIEVARSVDKDLRGYPAQVQRRIDEAIDNLADEPRPAGVKRLRTGLYRIRIGDYRVIYEINDREQLIIVWKAKHRREVYRDE